MIISTRTSFIGKRMRPLYVVLFTLACTLSTHSTSAQEESISVDSMVNRSHMLVRQGETKLAFDTLFYTLKLQDKDKAVDDYFHVLTALTFHLYYSDTYGELYPLEERMAYIDEAIALAIELEEDSIYTNKIYHKGVLHNINESIDSALFYFDKTIEWADKIGNDNILLQAYYFKSSILRDQGNLDASYQLLVEYEKAATRLKHGVHIQTVLQALGSFFVVKEDIEKSIEYYQKSLDAAREYNMDAYYSLTSLATSYMDIDSIALARDLLMEADKEIERIRREDEFDQGYAYKKMSLARTQGYLYGQIMGDYDSALLYLNQAVQMAEQLGHKESMAETRENIAAAYQAKGALRQALNTRIDNYPLAREVVNLTLRKQIEKNMAENYEALGLYDKALEHFKINRELSDSLLNIAQLEAVARLETEFETEKKEQEITLLNEQNERQLAKQTGLIIIGALLLVILIVVFVALKSKQKANKLITRQKETLSENHQKLTELSEFKENLTHMIVHDMKNPLNAVIGLSKGEATSKKLETISQSGHQMLSMVSNMLDVQKFEEAQVKLNTEAHRFDNLLKEASVHLELLMHAKNLSLKKSLSPELYVDVDGELVVRVLGNLLSNATKYSELGSQIEISNSQPDENGFVTISITDHGHGIPENQIDQVFNKYWQGAKPSGYSSSTGLGLTFCKLAVEAHGGSISVDSRAGDYTRFNFSLPSVPVTGMADQDLAQPMDREEALILESDIAILSKYISDLGQLKVHEVGKISSIIRKMDQEDIQSPWKSNLVSAMHQGNQDRFDELVEMLK